MGPFGAFGIYEELAGHAEVDYEVAAFELDCDEFAVAFNGFNALAGEGLGGVVRESAEDAELAEFGGEDAAAHDGRAQGSDYGFDFG
jgi:hypothetical protein